MKKGFVYVIIALGIMLTFIIKSKWKAKEINDINDVNIEQYFSIINKIVDINRAPGSDVSEDILLRPSDYKPGEVFSVINEPSVLEALEQKGFALINHIEPDMEVSDPLTYTNDKLIHNKKYQSFYNVITEDLKNIHKEESKWGMKSARPLNEGYLKSKISRYELVGVINRLDRASFNPANCGEMRFVYRLSYDSKAKSITSRLPMTLMVKYVVSHNQNENWQQERNEYNELPNEKKADLHYINEQFYKCSRFATMWTYPKQELAAEDLVTWYVSDNGPLSEKLINKGDYHSIETNIQAVRVPSTARPKLAGHAVYLLRVFKNHNGVLIPSLMENTLDVGKIRGDSKLKQELKDYLSDPKTFNRIDSGILNLPAKFLTDITKSYSPFGLARKDNRHLQRIFSEKELEEIFAPNIESKKKRKFVHSVQAAIMRVNDFSCVGCHQGRATAGFHFLGIDKASTHPLNALIFEGSGHFETELKRRKEFLSRSAMFNAIYEARQGGKNKEVLLNNKYAKTPDHRRDFSIAPPYNWDKSQHEPSGFGHFCGLKGTAYENIWSCAADLKCVQTDEADNDSEFGKCFPKDTHAGDPCVYGRITQEDRRSDALDTGGHASPNCADNGKHYTCSTPKGGFPGGFCTALVSDFGKKCEVSKDNPYETCGYFPGTGFNSCVIKMLKGQASFLECSDGYKGIGIRGKCNQQKACRNDYVCTRTGALSPGSRDGACSPSYFLFQVRADGHVDP